MTNRFSRPLSQNVPILPFVPEGYFHTDSRILGYFFPSAFEKCGANSFCHLWFLMRNSLSFELVHLIVKVQFFSFAVSRFFSLSLILRNELSLGVDFFQFILLGIFSPLLCAVMSFAKFGEFLIIIGIIFQAYPLLSLLWYLYAMNVRSFVIVSQALEGLFVVVFVFLV